VAERADPELRGAGQLAWMRRLDADRDNLLSALGWACDAGRADLAVRLGAALGWFWTVRGDHVDAAGWLNRADAVEGDAPAEARLVLHVYAAANTAATTGELAPAVRALTKAVTRARDLDPPPAHPMFPLLEALLPTFEERHEEAEAAWERVAAHPDPWVRGFATIIRGSLLANEGDLDRARPVFETGRELFAGIGDRWGLAMTLSSLGELRESAGDRDGAEAAVTEAMGLVQGLGVTDDWAHLLVRRSTYRARAGRLGEARADLALAAQVEPMQASWTPLLDAGLGEVARRAGDPGEARRCFQRGLDVGATRPFLPGQLKAMLLAGLAYAALDEGDPDAAAPLLREAAGPRSPPGTCRCSAPSPTRWRWPRSRPGTRPGRRWCWARRPGCAAPPSAATRTWPPRSRRPGPRSAMRPTRCATPRAPPWTGTAPSRCSGSAERRATPSGGTA